MEHVHNYVCFFVNAGAKVFACGWILVFKMKIQEVVKKWQHWPCNKQHISFFMAEENIISSSDDPHVIWH